MKTHELAIDPIWTISDSNFSDAAINTRVAGAPLVDQPFLRSTLNYLYGSIKTLDRTRLVSSSKYLTAAEALVARWLHTRTNGSERKNYGPDAVVAAQAAKYRCNKCKLPDVRVLTIDHVHGRGLGVLKEFECLCANCHMVKSRMKDWSGA